MGTCYIPPEVAKTHLSMALLGWTEETYYWFPHVRLLDLIRDYIRGLGEVSGFENKDDVFEQNTI